MTDVTPEMNRGLSRRRLLRNGLVAGLGAAAAIVAVPALTGVAEASVTDFATSPVNGATYSFTAQPNWWWCATCHALFASDASGSPRGTCAGNPMFYGNHTSSLAGIGSSWEYEVPYGNTGIASVQSKWNWCSACDVLWYSGSNNAGANRCMANSDFSTYVGPHTTGTWNYNVLYGGWGTAGPYLQSNWTWCSACGELFHNGGIEPTGSACPKTFGTTSHTAGSNWNYQLFTPQTR